MRTWADDLRRLCDALGLRRPVILGSSFGGDVALTYAALFPDHPGAIILANTTDGHWDDPRVIEAFGHVGGPEAAAIIERVRTYRRGGYAADAEVLQAEFIRVCYPLYSATPGWAEDSRRFLARMIRNPDVAAHYDSHEVLSFDPWSLLGAVRCPVLVLAGEDDPRSYRVHGAEPLNLGRVVPLIWVCTQSTESSGSTRSSYWPSRSSVSPGPPEWCCRRTTSSACTS